MSLVDLKNCSGVKSLSRFESFNVWSKMLESLGFKKRTFYQNIAGLVKRTTTLAPSETTALGQGNR